MVSVIMSEVWLDDLAFWHKFRQRQRSGFFTMGTKQMDVQLVFAEILVILLTLPAQMLTRSLGISELRFAALLAGASDLMACAG